MRVPAREVSIWFHPQRVVPNHLPGHISNLLSAAWLAPGLEHLVCLQAPTLIAPQSIVGFPHILLGLQVRSNHISPESQIKSQFPICFPHIFLGVLRVLQLPWPSSPPGLHLAPQRLLHPAPLRLRRVAAAHPATLGAGPGQLRTAAGCHGAAAGNRPLGREPSRGEHAVKQWLEYGSVSKPIVPL